MQLNLDVLPHVQDFILDYTTPNLGLVAGVGSGKTVVLQQKAILMAALNPGCLGIIASPTFAMLERNMLNMRNGLAVQLAQAGLPFEFKGGNTFFVKLPNGTTSEIECTHAGSSISGRTAAWFGVDEIDLMHTQDALDIWDILSARLRAENGRHFQGFCASTPEGHKFLWTKFVDEVSKKPQLASDFKLIHATTYDNFKLPPGFIERLESQYDAKRVRAHLNGEFVSLTQGQVYEDFDRNLNHTDLEIEEGEVLHTGWDFNNLGMSVTIGVIRDNKPLILDELMGSTNTPAAIDALLTRYPKHRIIAYPDATGKDIRSTTSSETDHKQLAAAGIQVIASNGNPRIMDRVGSLRSAICNSKGVRALKVNTKKCPILTGCLEQHTLGPDGLPRKRVPYGRTKIHIDGPTDALGYFIDKKWPVRRPDFKPIRLLGT